MGCFCVGRDCYISMKEGAGRGLKTRRKHVQRLPTLGTYGLGRQVGVR